MLLFLARFRMRWYHYHHYDHDHDADGWLTALAIISACVYIVYRWLKKSMDNGARVSLIESIRNDPSQGMVFSRELKTPVIRKTMQPDKAESTLLELSKLTSLKGFNVDHVQLIDSYNLLLMTSLEYTAVRPTDDDPDHVENDTAYHYFVLRYYPENSLMEVTTNAHDRDEEIDQKTTFGKLLDDVMEGR